jgi:hypothetical protein
MELFSAIRSTEIFTTYENEAFGITVNGATKAVKTFILTRCIVKRSSVKPRKTIMLVTVAQSGDGCTIR